MWRYVCSLIHTRVFRHYLASFEKFQRRKSNVVGGCQEPSRWGSALHWTVSYLKHIFVDGQGIGILCKSLFVVCASIIFRPFEGGIISGGFFDEETCQSQPARFARLKAYAFLHFYNISLLQELKPKTMFIL